MSGGWTTIESDAGVFTYLAENLGVKNVQCEELVSLDPLSLAQLHPLYGIIFLFRIPPETLARGRPTAPLEGEYDYDAAATSLFFAQQTIQNACGTQALLSILLNHSHADTSSPSGNSDDPDGVGTIDIGPQLREFRELAMPLPSEFRGEALGNSELIRTTHNTFARANPFAMDDPTSVVDAEDAEDVYHFIAYLPHNGSLYELDGMHEAPINHNIPCTLETFAEAVVDVLQRRIARFGAQEIHFNLLAVTRDQRLAARERGDAQGLAREDAKRRAWVFENSLRQHNFVGLAGEVLRGLARHKLTRPPAGTSGEANYQQWIDQGRANLRKAQQSRALRKELNRG